MRENEIREKIAERERRLKEIRRPRTRNEVTEKDLILEDLETLRAQLPRDHDGTGHYFFTSVRSG